MFDFPIDKIDESPALRHLINNLIKAARMEYAKSDSLVGAALRDLVGAVRSPSHQIWKELKIPSTERQSYHQVASAAHHSLKGE